MPQVIAHRGDHQDLPENSLAAFEAAVRRGAHGIEFDIRLSSDGEPFVFHNFELDGISKESGPLVALDSNALRRVELVSFDGLRHTIPSLHEVLDIAAGQTILEMELKSLEPAVVSVTAAALLPYQQHWELMEITSFEPALLRAMTDECSIAVDVLLPRHEPWMTPDYMAYSAVHRARLSEARAVHLHVAQLTPETVSAIRRESLDVHVHGVNGREDLDSVLELDISRFDTDHLDDVLSWLADTKYEPAV